MGVSCLFRIPPNPLHHRTTSCRPRSSLQMPPTATNVEYVLFDMDGLLLDSEAIYTKVTDTILADYGKTMSWDIKAGCMGKPEQDAAAHLLSFFPDISLTAPDYLKRRNALQDELWPTVPLLPGVRKLVLHLKAHNVPMAVATSSRRRNFELKTGHHGEIFGCFEGKIVCGDDTQWNMRGKPEPDIFLVAAREILGRDVGAADATDVTADQLAERRKGLVFEDALPGMQAGKRAEMSVVWVPDAQLLNVEYSGEEKADQILKSLEDFVPEQWGLPPYAQS
ncbi:HAD-like domain-containing protein [Mycena rosella]|uniref:HAD-like domain-containing protein n=1 Tax=Mycena rosella TaxID=1033263 RepID=A0AAD7CVF5_MYCRO|nr:HAD-like domain-containing protein [Mycena rosella]